MEKKTKVTWEIAHDPHSKFEGKSLDMLKQLISDHETVTVNIYDLDGCIIINGEAEL